MRLGRRAVAGCVLAVCLAVPGTVPASADDGDVIRRGSCAGTSHWKVKVGPENGRIEFSGEIDSSRNRQTWTWRMMHNGSLSARGQKITRRPSGSFTVSRVMVNLGGRDRFAFRARHPRSGEVCRGTVNF